MQDLKAELLRGLWYVALPGAELRPGRMVHKTLLGEPLLIGRGRGNRVFALRDICPHRGIPLHYGAVRRRHHRLLLSRLALRHGPAPASRFPRCAKASRWTSPRSAAGPIRASSGKA